MQKTRKRKILFLMVFTAILIQVIPFIGSIMVKEVAAAESTAKIETFKVTRGIEGSVDASDYVDLGSGKYTYKS